MSRYTIAARQLDHTCVVGYDPPLGTFFAQVHATRSRRHPQELLWVGTDLQEILTVTALAQVIADFAILPVEICHRLETDQRTQGFRPNLGTVLMHTVNTTTEEEPS